MSRVTANYCCGPVVAELLSKFERRIKYWEIVAENVKSFVTNDPDEQCLYVLGFELQSLDQ